MSVLLRSLRGTHRPTKPITRAALAVALGLALASPLPLAAQAVTSAFTYQGELRTSGNPANANFDMEFRLFNAATGGTQIGPVVTRLNVPAVNGLFNVQLDFGPSQFAGDRQWLEVRIKPAGSGSYETLSPRTEVTATPYALGAVAALPNSVTTTSIVDGTIGTADINATQIQRRVTGSCPTGQYVRVVAQDGTVTCGTDATGSGTVTSIATGAGLAGGPITTSGTISVAPGGIGTTEINATQVQRRVTGTCTGTNYVQQVNADGTVGCGPAPAASGWSLTGNAGTNPTTNFIGTTDAQPLDFRVNNERVFRIEPNGESPNITAGFSGNLITFGVTGGVIGGGGLLGGPNRVTDDYGVVGGGRGNRAGNDFGLPLDAPGATVGGGVSNIASGHHSTVSGGGGNIASAGFSTVAGGDSNTVSESYGTLSGGRFNRVLAIHGVVGGGTHNTASGSGSVVAGGVQNWAYGQGSVISGGFENQASGLRSFIAGGERSWAIGDFGVVSGGESNCAGAGYSWVGGRQAKVRPANAPTSFGPCSGLTYPGGTGDQGSFVWADSQETNFVSTGENQFLIRAAGGMAINTNAPRGTLTVTGTDKWNPTVGNGWGDFTVGDATRGLAVGVSLTGGGAGTVRLWGKGGTENIVFTSATNPSFDTLVVASAGRAGVRRFPAANAFEVEGNASKTTAGDWLANSDARIKTEVSEVTGAVERILKLRPVTFRYTPEYRAAHPSVGDGVYWNVIAQEYAEVFPEAVKGSGEHVPGLSKTAENEILQVDLHPATVTTIAAVQELAVRLEQAEADNAALRARLDRLEALIGARGSAGDAER